MVTQIYKIRSEIWVALPPKFGGPKRSNFGAISENFANWSRISPERNKRSSIGKKGVVNYDTFADKLNSVYFGPQMAKNRTGALTLPTGGHQAGHCHAYCHACSVGLILPRLREIAGFLLKTAPHPYSTRNFGCSPWTRLPMLGIRGAKALS